MMDAQLNAFHQAPPANPSAVAAGAPLPAALAGYANAFRARRAEAARPPAPAVPPFLVAPEQAARRAEILSALARALAARPYGERRGLLTHMAPDLARVGVDPRALASFDPTDDQLGAAARQADALRQLLTEDAGASN